MKFINICLITFIYSIFSVISEPICEDENGNLIPCQKVIEKIDDFELASSKQKRDYYSNWLSDWLWNPWNWWYNTRVTRTVARPKITTARNPVTKKTSKTLPKRTTKTIPINLNTPAKRVTTQKKVTTQRKVTSAKRVTTTKKITTTRKISTNIPSSASSKSNSSGSKLDKKPFSMTLFKNCSADQAEKVRKTIDDIITYRAAGLYVAKDTSDPQSKQIFLKYFKNESTRSKVVRTLENVNNMSTAAAYCETNADSACAQRAIAWTYLRSKEFHVCPAFFTQVWHGTIEKHTSEAASVVLHELTHCHGTDDYAYGDAGCNGLDASRASNNADSFRLFCMNAIYHLNDKSSGVMKFVNNTNIDFRVEPFHDKVIIRAVEKEENY